MTKIQPVFFITDERGHPQLTVDGSSRQPFRFVWDKNFPYKEGAYPRKGAYVLRFASLEEMEARQFEIQAAQHKWTLHFKVEVIETDETIETAFRTIDEQKRELKERNEQVARLERALELAESERIQNYRPTTIPGQKAASHVEPEPPTPKMPTYGVDSAVPTPAAPAPSAAAELPVNLNTALQDRDLADILGDDVPAGPRRPTQVQTSALPSVPKPLYGDGITGQAVVPPVSLPEHPSKMQLEVPPAPATGLDVPPPPADAQASIPEETVPDEAASPLPTRPTQRPGKHARQPAPEPKAL